MRQNHLAGRIGLELSLGWRQLKSDWRIFSHNRLAVIGVVLIIIFGLMAVSHPILLATVWPKTIYDPVVGYAFDVMGPQPAPPSPAHLLGTDALGRDVLSMLLAGTGQTFLLALTAATATAVTGTTLGALAAYYGRRVDAIILHTSKAFLLLPAPLFMVVVGARENHLGAAAFGLIYGVLAGLGSATIVMRAQALTILNKPFIEAARVSGCGAGRIILSHLVPHMLPLAAVHMMMAVTGAVIADGFIWFLGLRSTRINWGSMIYNALTYQGISAGGIPWMALIAPSLALSLFAAAFYLVARGLHEVADPQLRED
jgi:peptide/nickel transport system permease protein